MMYLKVTGLTEIRKKFERLPVMLESKGFQFFKARDIRYSEIAQSIIQSIVYDVYQPYAYQRTKKLLDSARAETMFIGMTKMIISCDPSMTPGQSTNKMNPKWFDVYPTYSMDVLSGSGSVGKYTGPRNWLPMWMKTFGEIIPAEYHKSVIESTLRNLFRGKYAS